VAVCCPLWAQAQVTIHVALCGDDDWSGLSSACTGPDGPKRTIQAAIDIATHGDTVLVAEGTYSGAGNHDLDFGGRAITLRCSGNGGGGAVLCIIDAQGTPANPRRGFRFHSGEGSDSIVEGFTITGGHAAPGGGGGGARIESSSPHFKNCIFRLNTAHTGAIGDGGGAVSIVSGSPTFIGCTFEANHVEMMPGVHSIGGGALRGFGASPVLIECEILNNTAAGAIIQHGGIGGGGMLMTGGGTSVLTDCTLLGNSTSADGGGVLLWGANATLTGCRIEDNTARNGAGYLSFLGGTSILENCTIRNNRATECCGGVTIYDAMADITQTSFIGNQALDGAGGGLLVQVYGDVRLRDVLFQGNSAVEGGALWVADAAMVSLDRGRFKGNTARDDGGGVAVIRGGNAWLTNALFTHNQAAAGGALFIAGGSGVTLVNCTLADNTAEASGGAVSLAGVPLVSIYNSILWFNMVTATGVPLPQQIATGGAPVDLRFSNMQGGASGPNVIAADPLFRDRPGGNFRIEPHSPSVDAGDISLLPAGITLDLDGQPRAMGAAVDMGAYELQVASCYPNCDGSTIEPVLNVEDFTCFINEFAQALGLPHPQQIMHYANCDLSTTAPVLNVEDFTCFINRFAQGCR
jgi:hypothetical protein